MKNKSLVVNFKELTKCKIKILHFNVIFCCKFSYRILKKIEQYVNHSIKNNIMNKALCKYREGNDYSVWTYLLNPKLIYSVFT